MERRAGRARILAQMSYSSAARYVGHGLRILRGFGLAHFLGPVGFGTWNSMRIVLQFSSYVDAGARLGMLQHATHADAAGQRDTAARLRETTATIDLACAALVAALIIAVVSIPGLGVESRVLWYGLAGIVIADNVWGYLLTSLRSQRRYGLSTSLSLVITTLSTGLGVLGAWLQGIAGFLWALVLSHLIAFGFAWLLDARVPGLRFEKPLAARLVTTGLPIMIGDLLKTLMWNVDKIFVWVLMGKHALGIYAMQATITNAIMLLPSGITQVLYPHVVAGISRSKAAATSQRYLTHGAELFSRAMTPVLAIAFLALHLPIRWLLPAYVETIAPGQVLVLATYFPIAATVAGSVLVALGGQRTSLMASAAGVVAAAVGVGLAILAGGGYVAIALGAAAGLLTRAAISTTAAMSRAELPAVERGRFLRRLALRFAQLVAAVVAVSWMIPDAPASPWLDCLYTALRCVVVLAVFAPGLIGAWREQRREGWLRPERPMADTTNHE